MDGLEEKLAAMNVPASRYKSEGDIRISELMIAAGFEVLDRWQREGFEMHIAGSTLSNTYLKAFIEQIYAAMRVLEDSPIAPRQPFIYPPTREIDETPSGFIETLYGSDGRLRRYVRLVDHENILEKIDREVQSQADDE